MEGLKIQKRQGVKVLTILTELVVRCEGCEMVDRTDTTGYSKELTRLKGVKGGMTGLTVGSLKALMCPFNQLLAQTTLFSFYIINNN